MENCIFCDIINNKLPAFKIYEDEHCVSFLDIFPNSEGHTLVIPKQHFVDYASTNSEVLAAVAVAKKHVVEILEQNLPHKPKGYNYVSNQGSEAFQMVFHYHEHIIPKYLKAEGYCLKIKHNENNLSPEEIHKYFK